MKRKLLFTTCLMLLSMFMFGQTPKYVVGDLGDYSHNFTITTAISFDDVVSDKELELGVYCNGEVRASVFTADYYGNGKYVAMLNVFGETGDVFTFKVYDHATQTEWENGYITTSVESTPQEYISFASDKVYGSLDAPCVIDFATPNHWNPDEYKYENTYTITAVVEIDGVEQFNPNFELGAFCNGEVRGSAKTDFTYTYNGNTRYYVLNMTIYGKDNDVVTFKLYDNEQQVERNFVDVVNPITLGEDNIGTILEPLKINFLTTPYVAQVGEVKYQSFANAFNAALENNATIKLLENFAIDSETYTVADGKNVTLNMNGKKITVKDNKTSNYELFYIYGGMTVEGEGTIELTSANNRGWNAMSAIFHNRGGDLTIKNGTYKNLGGTDMAWVVDNSGNYYGDATTNINGGTLTSTYTAIRNRMEQNTHGASGKAILNVDGGTIEGTTSAIWAQAASESTTAPATGEINITGGKVGLINTARSAGAVSMTTVAGGTVAAFKGEAGELKVQGGTITGKVTIMTAEGVEVPYAITSEGLYVAAVAEVNGTNYATLQEAVKVGGTVKVLQNIVLTETVTINADKTVVLDLNGKTVTGTPTEAKAYAVITNKGNLTIMNGSIVCNHILAGSTGYAVNTITNCGTLTIDGATIKNESTADFQIGYAIDNNSTSTNAVLVVNSGVVEASGSNYYDGIRQFCNSEVRENSVTINDGEVSSLWMQNPSDGAEKNTKDVKGSFAIEGGKVGVVSTEPSANFTASITAGEIGKVEYFQVSEGRNLVNFITGGTFGMDVTEFCAPAYICEPNADGTYSVKGGLKGSGTEADPYLITNLTELVYFRNSVNAGETKYNAPGVYVALGADIDMASVDWSVNIGDDCNYTFDGIFDGKGFTLSNLNSTETAAKPDGYICTGLFGAIYDKAVVKNFTIENVTINTGDYTGNNVAAVVGFAYNCIGSVENVTVQGNVNINATNVTGVGAIVGYDYYGKLTVEGCSVLANDGSVIKGAAYVGGIIGYASSNSKVNENTVENININATSCAAGGVAGIMLATGSAADNKVKDVAITANHANWQNSAAAVVGCITGTITVSNSTIENVTPATVVGSVHADHPTTPVAAVQARIGDKYYTTFAAALEAAQAGEEITLLTDIEASEVILIGKSVTINGNGHKVTSSASRVFRLTTSDTEVTLNGVNMVSTAVRVGTNDIRGISIDANLSDVEMTLNNCSVDFTDGSANDWAYAVNVSGNGTGHKVTVDGGTYEGANVINVHGANNTVVVKNATLNSMYPNNDMYTGACFWVLQNQGSSVEATGNTFNGDNAVAFNLGTGTNLTESNNIDNTRFVVAKVDGTYYYSVNTAINEAQNDATVQLLYRTIDEVIAPWAGDSQHTSEKSITIVGAENFGTTLTGGLFLGYNDGTVRENTITVKGINFEGKGVTVANQKNVVIEGNKFTGINALVSEKHGNSGSAILVIGSENNKSIVATVKNNVIENVTLASQAGIYMSQVANVTVEGNTVAGTTHNAITISAATDATINVTNNTLSDWGKGGEGRAMRISGGATVNVNGNVMSNTAAPEEFVKITGATDVDASENYWNGVSPLTEGMFTGLTSDPVDILKNYYIDVEKNNLVVLEKSVAKIDTKYYQSFASAIAAVKNGETIELLTDCDEEVTIKQVVNKNFTINGNGKTYTGTINVNGNNKGAGLTGAGLTITNVNFVLNGQWQSGIFANKGTYACNIIVDQCSFTGNNAKEAYGIRLRSGYNITVKNITGKNLYDLVYAQENVKGFTAENVTVTDSNIGFWFPYGNNLNFKDVNLNVTGTGVGIINRNEGEATFQNCTIIAKNAVTLSQDNNNAIAYTLKFNGENEFTTSEEWLTVTGTNAVLKAVLNDAELDVTETSGLVANIGNVYYNTLQHAINAAQDGGTVAIANDFTLDSKKYETQNDGYATLVNVKDKAVTIDLNGKTVTVETLAADLASAKSAMLLSVFHADTNGQLTLVDSSADSSADGTGTVNVKVNDAKVYSVFASESQYTDKTNSGKLTVKTGNYTTVGKLTNAMCFSDADDVITINGGNFHLDYASTIANYPWFVNTLGNNELQVIVNGGTFNVDINHQYRPFEIYIKKELALKNNGDGTWTIVPAEAYVTELLGSTVNESGKNSHEVGYATLAEAVAAVNNLGKDVTLLKDVTIDELIKIEKEATLDLNGNKVTSTAKKAFEVYANATITNGTIEAANRAVDTRKAVELTLTDVTLVADKYYSAYGNPQPLTIGGYDHGTVVTLNNVDINAGTAGYGIITFVKTTLTADEKTNVYGYAALYVQDGSEGSEFVFNGSTLTGDLTGNDVEGNSFSTIAIQEDGVNVTMNGGKLISVGDNHTALSIGNVNVPVHENNNVTIDAEITGNILSTVCADENVIRVKAEYADNLNAAGYATSEPEDGLVKVLGQAVAQVEDALFATLQDAVNAADGKTVEVLANIAQSGTTVVTGTVTIDLNGFTVAYTSANPGEDMITVKGGTLVINDSESDGKITYVNTDATAGNVTVSTISVEPNSTLVVNGGTIENKTVKADGSSIYSYAIDILTNGGLGDVNVTINGGTVYSDYMAIRQFNNGTACKNTLVVTDGYIYGAKRAIQIHMDNNAAYTTISGGKVEGGNYSLCFLTTSENISVLGGEFIGEVWYSGSNGFIKGGTFTTDVNDYCAYGYTAEYNEDDELYYVKETYGTQTHSFQAGWNWFSSYVDLSQQGGLEKLQTALGESGIQIKGQSKNQSSVYQHLGNNIYDWIGDFALSTSKMYMVNTSAAVSAPISGDFVDYENEALLLKSGWNWISYPLNQEVDINTALQNLDATQGDNIKGYGTTSIATYYNGKWVGPLATLNPGQGYMYQSAKQTSFVYSTEGNTANASKSNVSAEETYWTPSMSEYANNMVVFATLRSGEMSDNYEVAAFANGECRGSARPIYIEQLDQYMLFMTIYGDEVEEMTFKCYDVNNGTEYDLINRMVYSNDAVVGSLDEPYIFTCSTTGIGEATLSDINIYPNPTTTDREINLQATCDKVEVFNTLGVKVAEYQNVDTIDALETAGTYVIRVTLNGDVKHCRLVVK